MAVKEHIAQLEKGVNAWNAWLDENPDTWLSLSGANLSGANLSGVNLRGADLRGADLSGADLSKAHLLGANFARANLAKASFWQANLAGASLVQANLTEANLRLANLFRANLWDANLHKACLAAAQLGKTSLVGANLREADLEGAVLTDTNLNDADLTGCAIYGISIWNVYLTRTKQENLRIIRQDTERRRTEVMTVDNIEVAQFIWLMLHNNRIRYIIDTITSKVVLILGRFTEGRKKILDALQHELRRRDYLPVIFDFERPANQTTDETITLLARMARFVIADISDAKSVLQELRAIVPDLPSVAVQPLILRSQEEPGMFDFFNPRLRPSVLETYRYDNLDQLITDLGERVLGPVELKVQELRGRR